MFIFTGSPLPIKQRCAERALFHDMPPRSLSGVTPQCSAMGLSFGFPPDVSCSTQFRRPISVPVIGGTASLWVPGSPIVDSLYFSSYSKLGSLTILGDAKKAPDWVACATAGSMGYAGHFGIPGCVWTHWMRGCHSPSPYGLRMGKSPGPLQTTLPWTSKQSPAILEAGRDLCPCKAQSGSLLPTLKAEGSDLKVRWGQFTFWPHLPVGV